MSHCPPAVHAFLNLRSGNSQEASGNGKRGNGGGAGAGLSHLIADVSSGEGEEIDLVSSLSALLIGICVCYNNGAVEGYDR